MKHWGRSAPWLRRYLLRKNLLPLTPKVRPSVSILRARLSARIRLSFRSNRCGRVRTSRFSTTIWTKRFWNAGRETAACTNAFPVSSLKLEAGFLQLGTYNLELSKSGKETPGLLGMAHFPWVSPMAMNIQPLRGWGPQKKQTSFKKQSKSFRLAVMGRQPASVRCYPIRQRTNVPCSSPMSKR